MKIENLYATVKKMLTDEIEGLTFYDFNEDEAEKFPCVSMKFSSADNEYLTSNQNVKAYAMDLFIYQESVINGKAISYEKIFLPMVSKIADMFDEKWDGNLWDIDESTTNRIWAKSDIINTGITDRGSGKLLYANVRLIINLTNDI